MKKFTRMIALTSGLMALTLSAVLADEMGSKAATAAQPAKTPAASKSAAKPKAKVAKKKAVKEKYVWVCPMGDYTGDKPGKCPNCQMDLVKQKVTESKPASDKNDKKM